MVNKGVTPPSYSTTVGQTRALLGDTDSVPLNPVEPGYGEYAWYSDDELLGLLSVYSNNPRRAAAQALRTVAVSQSLLLKKWSADDLSVDGPAITRAILQAAKDLDDQADNEALAEDIFVISYPGRNTEWVPEGFPREIGRTQGAGIRCWTDGSWHLDPDGYIVD